MVNQSQRLDAVFSALSDPTRRRMIERLARGPLSIGEIGAGFGISQPAVSKHVRVLEDSGLIERAVRGRVHECRLAPHAMETAGAWIERQRKFWNAVLDRLGDVLADSERKK